MKIVVCISNVPDTTTKIKFKDGDTAMDPSGVQWIINPWDELALTRALELKEGSGGAITEVAVASVGNASIDPTIRKALAIGADRAIRVDVDPTDAGVVASQLAHAFTQDSFDIILCGIESSDFNGSVVGGMLAENLGLDAVSSVSSLEVDGSTAKMKREIPGGSESVEISTPVVAMVQKGITKEPRIPNMRGIMMARQKPLGVVAATDVAPLTRINKYVIPAAKGACKMIDAEEAGSVVELLHSEAKVI